MAQQLHGKKVAVLATDGVEQVELTEPVKALKSAGAVVDIEHRRGLLDDPAAMPDREPART